MKSKFLMVLLSIVMFANLPAVAQPDPYLEPDTVAMVMVVDTQTLKATVEVWGWNDSTLKGATGGYRWANPNLQMDSAVADTFITNLGGNIIALLENGDINVTNANQRFLFGFTWMALPGNDPIPPVSNGRRLWATYYFSLSSWDGATDHIVLDTLTFSAGSAWLFVAPSNGGQAAFGPVWGGSVAYPPGGQAELQVDNTSLTFDVTEADPIAWDTIRITSTLGAARAELDLEITGDETWLLFDDDLDGGNLRDTVTGQTPMDVLVAVNLTGQTPGSYNGNVDINSWDAANSPFAVPVTATVLAADNLVVDPTSITFDLTGGLVDWDTLSITSDNPARAELNFTVEPDAGETWLLFDDDLDGSNPRTPVTGTTPMDVLVVGDFTGQPPGLLEGDIRVSSPEAGNSPLTVGASGDVPSGVYGTGDGSLPTSYELSQNFPNPFNLMTQIKFQIPERAHVTLAVFNILGQRVATLVDRELAPDYYVAEWDATNDAGSSLSSGIYFYKLTAGDFRDTRKMMLIK